MAFSLYWKHLGISVPEQGQQIRQHLSLGSHEQTNASSMEQTKPSKVVICTTVYFKSVVLSTCRSVRLQSSLFTLFRVPRILFYGCKNWNCKFYFMQELELKTSSPGKSTHLSPLFSSELLLLHWAAYSKEKL